MWLTLMSNYQEHSIQNIVNFFNKLKGGGIPVGTLVLIDQDVPGSYSKILLKYFLSEGVVSGHSLFIANLDCKPDKIVLELPTVADSSQHDSVNAPLDDKMTIAWRYQGLRTVETSPCTTSFGHHFDLSKTMDGELLANTDIHFWGFDLLKPETFNPESAFNNPVFEDLLTNIQRTIEDGGFNVSASPEKRNILRIIIDSMGSPFWYCESDDDDEIKLQRDMSLFLYSLRGLLRSAYAVCMVSIPSSIYQESSVIKRCQHLCDICVRLESFAGSDNETNPALKDYHGFFHLTKLPSINSISCHVPESLDLAFKLRRKKFLIEKLHLPPELQESAQREQDDLYSLPQASGGCGDVGGSKKLDF